jgi:hypothetical protein
VMEMAVRSMETDGDGSGGTSPSRQGAGIETSVPEIRRRWWRSYGTLSRNLPILLGLSVGRLIIGEGASSGGDQGGHTIGGRSQGLGHAPYCVGSPWPPSGSRSVFGPLPGKIGVLELISSNSENISRVAFLKHKTAENWHCGILLVG